MGSRAYHKRITLEKNKAKAEGREYDEKAAKLLAAADSKAAVEIWEEEEAEREHEEDEQNPYGLDSDIDREMGDIVVAARPDGEDIA